MKTFEQENQTIRQFLLGQLPDEQVEQLEDRIFTEPDFAEEVQIVEGELIADQQAGRLTPQESKLLSARYNATKANQFNLDYEVAFQEFVSSKHDSAKETLEIITPDDSAKETVEIVRPDDSMKETVEIIRPPSRAKPQPPVITHASFWRRFVFHFGPQTAYATVAIALLFLAVAIWFFASPSRPDLSARNRQAIEAELARLNSAGAAPENILSTVDLDVAHRSGGAMARIAFDTTPDKVFEFHLNLTQFGARKYRVLVFDDQRHELFAVPNLSAQNTESGPQIRLLIPVNYLKPGDYQIDLSLANQSGGYDQVNSYAFRVADPQK